MSKATTHFWRNFIMILKPYWYSKERWSAIFLLTIIVVTVVLNVAVAVEMNFTQKMFFNALQAYDKKNLFIATLKYIGLLIALFLSYGYLNYCMGKLIIRWRRWHTHQYVSNWLSKHKYYQMQFQLKNSDNPDQRIVQDLNDFPELTLELFVGLLNAIITLCSFGAILWNISGVIAIPFGNVGQIHLHGYLLWVAILFTLIATLIAIQIGKPLRQINYLQQKFTANYRKNLIYLQKSSEQIAFAKGEHCENHRASLLFKKIYDNYMRLIRVEKRLNFFSNGFMSAAYLFSLVVAAPLFLAKKIKLGGLMQAMTAFNQVQFSLGFIIRSYEQVAELHAVIQRLVEFSHVMALFNTEPMSKIIYSKKQSAKQMMVKSLSVYLPDGNQLLSNINFSVSQGRDLLISGASGVGKSTLLRAIAGFWPYGSGEVIMPDASVMFLSQQPYFFHGTLLANLAYPQQVKNIDKCQLKELLQVLKLSDLVAEFYTYCEWDKVLSMGERQRLGIARVLLQQPTWLFLDEATSAMDEQMSLYCYQLIKQYIPDITLISIGHADNLKLLHDDLIVIESATRKTVLAV